MGKIQKDNQSPVIVKRDIQAVLVSEGKIDGLLAEARPYRAGRARAAVPLLFTPRKE
jgi:hypothetical protein